MEQSQQDADRFLLIPGDDQGEGELIYPHFECGGKGIGDLDSRIGVIALSGIQQARDAADIAELLVKKAVFATGEGQNDAVLGYFSTNSV
jgi:hypothetical protein